MYRTKASGGRTTRAATPITGTETRMRISSTQERIAPATIRTAITVHRVRRISITLASSDRIEGSTNRKRPRLAPDCDDVSVFVVWGVWRAELDELDAVA